VLTDHGRPDTIELVPKHHLSFAFNRSKDIRVETFMDGQLFRNIRGLGSSRVNETSMSRASWGRWWL